MMPVLRRGIRALFWFGLFAVPFFGTALLVGGAFVVLHTLRISLGVLPLVFIGMGLLVWMGLIRAYRFLVPMPCRKCGRSAKVTSLNPITIRCGRCGHVEVFEVRVLGAQ